MSDTQINLIQRDVTAMGKLSSLEDVLRKIALWYLGGLCITGIIVSGLIFSLRARIQNAQAQKIDLVREINTQSVKESILVALKDRISIAGKALDAAKPWGNLFTVLNTIAPSEAFTSLSIDETGRVSTSLELASVDDAVGVITNIMTLSSDRSLKTPQMLGFTFREDGKIQLSVSFFPIFTL